MDPLEQQIDQKIAEALADTQPATGPARILIVGGDASLREAVLMALRQRPHGCTCVINLEQARTSLARQQFDLVILHSTIIAEIATAELVALLQQVAPATKAIVVAETLSIQAALAAMRCGAVDFVCLPVEPAEFARRVEAALLKARVDQHRDDKLSKLKKVCRELNTSRREITKQIDALCDDLNSAYHDIAIQMSDVAMASEFRTLLRQELDVEDLLRTTLEYLLIKTGPTNAAVFLPDAEQNYGLGAYVNYDCPRETIATLLDHLCHAICPQMADETELVSFDDADEFAQWIGAEAGFLADSHIIAFSCLHKGECLAVIVLFRNRIKMFDDKIAATLDTLRSILAEQLANVIRVHHRARPSWPKEAREKDLEYDDDLGFGFEGGLAA